MATNAMARSLLKAKARIVFGMTKDDDERAAPLHEHFYSLLNQQGADPIALMFGQHRCGYKPHALHGLPASFNPSRAEKDVAYNLLFPDSNERKNVRAVLMQPVNNIGLGLLAEGLLINFSDLF